MTDAKALAEEIARTLASYKAYDLPTVVERLGLPVGDPQDAWHSKRLYVRSKLQGMSVEDLHALGERVLQEVEDADLRERMDLIADKSQPTVSPITRVKILEELAQFGAVEGGRELLEMLALMWPIHQMPPTDGFTFQFDTLADEIWQHMVRNTDWTYGHLFATLGLERCSQRRFFRFLEECVHPLSREGDNQRRLVDELNRRLISDGFELQIAEVTSGHPIFRVTRRMAGVQGRFKNLIFAADGPKPDLVLADAISNDVLIVRNAEHCLVFDRPVPTTGLLWRDLVDWWASHMAMNPADLATERSLYERLNRSLASEAEQRFFRRYFKIWRGILHDRLPALLPQVYLHYDPLTIRQRASGKVVPRQRMDFLLLFSAQQRVIVEIDGKHHYAEENVASPSRYAEMVAADRDLRLSGYEVYRFGGSELFAPHAEKRLDAFMKRLFERHHRP
jgi:very-short-patch-repair endonuclease